MTTENLLYNSLCFVCPFHDFCMYISLFNRGGDSIPEQSLLTMLENNQLESTNNRKVSSGKKKVSFGSNYSQFLYLSVRNSRYFISQGRRGHWTVNDTIRLTDRRTDDLLNC